MYNGQIIKQLLVEKNIQNKELLSYLGTEANSSLSQIVNGNPTVKRSRLFRSIDGCIL